MIVDGDTVTLVGPSYVCKKDLLAYLVRYAGHTHAPYAYHLRQRFACARATVWIR